MLGSMRDGFLRIWWYITGRGQPFVLKSVPLGSPSWVKEAEDLPFEWAAKLICHHIILAALVLSCGAAPSLDFKVFVAGVAVVCISVPFLLMMREIKTIPNKYLLWDTEEEKRKGKKTFDHMRAVLGPHRFFVAQDKNGDVHPHVPHPFQHDDLEVHEDNVTRDKAPPAKAETAYQFFCKEARAGIKEAGAAGDDVGKVLQEKWEAMPAEEKAKFEQMAVDDKARYEKECAYVTTALQPTGLCNKQARRVRLDKEKDPRLGIPGFQAMLGMSTQLYMLYAAVLLFCLGDSVPAIRAHMALTGGGEVALLDGDESLTLLRTATKCLLCVVLLFYALSISVPSKKSAGEYWKRVNDLERDWPHRYKMRGKVNDACFRETDKAHKEFFGSCLYLTTGIGLPILLEMMVAALYFCADETGCHLPQSPVDMLSTVIFVWVGLLTLFSLHAWVILEFRRLARISISRLQIFTQLLREDINRFDKSVHDEKVDVKVPAEELVKDLRTWQVTRTFFQRNVNSFFFKNIAFQVILLIVCMVCCTVTLLLRLLAPHRFDSVLHHFGILGAPFAAGVTVLGLVALWCLGIVYSQACYILNMDTARLEQLQLLRSLELSLKSTMTPEDAPFTKIRDASTIALNVASFVRDYVSEHDEPPSLLGVRVDPTFITYLHRSIGVTVAGWVLSAITSRMERHLM